MDIDRDRDEPREGFERVRARPTRRSSASVDRAMDGHTQKKKICLARRRASSRLESSLARVSRRAYLGRVEDVRVVRALDRLRALRGFQGDGVSREDGAAGDLGAGGAARGDADRRADRGGGGDGESGHDSG